MKNFLADFFITKRIERLANICDSAGQVMLAVLVITPLSLGFDKINVLVLVLGLVSTFAFWIASLYFAGKKRL